MIFAAVGHKTTISYDEATGRTIACEADFTLASEAVTGIYNKILVRNYDSAPGVKGRMNQVSCNVGGTADPGNHGAPVTGEVPGATAYSYVPGSDLLAGMSTARMDGKTTSCDSNGLNQTPSPSSPMRAYNCLMA